MRIPPDPHHCFSLNNFACLALPLYTLLNSEASYHHDSTEAEGGTVAIQDSYAEDSYNYGGGEGYEDQGGYDDGAYEQTLQTVNADGNKGEL